MAEKKKMIVKTVNRSGKALIKKALVIHSAKQNVNGKEAIKKLNEKILNEKAIDAKKEVKKIEEVRKEEVKIDKKYNLTVGLKDLLDAGCHLGHKISKTHPKARDYIYVAKDGMEIIDLTKTLEALDKACNFIYNAKRNGKQIILVGTKRQSKEVVKRIALDAGVPYITDRWLGGTITNWEQIKKNIKRLVTIREGIEKGTFTSNTKKEILMMKKESIRLEKIVGGLVGLEKMFDILFVIDASFEKTAVKEAKIKGIKTIAVVDTDSNPYKVDYAIPANDDNVKSVSLIVEEIGKAIKAAGVK